MKTLKSIAIGLSVVLMGILFTACPTNQGLISIQINPAGNLEVAPGTTVAWDVTLTPDSTQRSALGTFYFIVDNDTLRTFDLGGQETATTFQVSLTIPDSIPDGTQFNVTFLAVDAYSGLQNSVSIVITVKATSSYNELADITLTYNSTSLDNQMMLVLTADGYSLEGGTSTNGQIAYMYNGDATILNTLASPNAQEIVDAYSANGVTYTTSDKQETYFKKVTGSYVWDNIGQADCENISLDATTSDLIAGSSTLGYGVSTLAVGDIIEFYNPATNVKGFIKVNSYSTAKSNLITTTLNIDVKYVVGSSTTAK